MYKLAVIQSVYKNDKPDYLIQALDSIFNQTYKDFTLFLGVDGPISDDLRCLIESVRDKRLRVIYYRENRGLAFVLNDLLAVLMNEGFEYIARMDSDDIAVANRFEKQLAYLHLHHEVDVIGGAVNEINERGEDRGRVIRYPCEPEGCYAFFSKRNPIAHPTALFRRRFFEKTNCFYPTDFVRNEDTRLWHEGFKHGCIIANITDVLLNFRMTNDMFKQRRNGHKFAKSQLKLRWIIAKDLNYGFMSYVYAHVMYLLMVSPSWLLKLAYKFMR